MEERGGAGGGGGGGGGCIPIPLTRPSRVLQDLEARDRFTRVLVHRHRGGKGSCQRSRESAPRLLHRGRGSWAESINGSTAKPGTNRRQRGRFVRCDIRVCTRLAGENGLLLLGQGIANHKHHHHHKHHLQMPRKVSFPPTGRRPFGTVPPRTICR